MDSIDQTIEKANKLRFNFANQEKNRLKLLKKKKRKGNMGLDFEENKKRSAFEKMEKARKMREYKEQLEVQNMVNLI